MKRQLTFALLAFTPFLNAQSQSSISPAEYQKHLGVLFDLTQDCAGQSGRGAKCDPAVIGPDDHVRLSADPHSVRTVDYAWLRYVFAEANDDAARKADPKHGADLLAAAEARLARDARTLTPGWVPAPPGASRERLQTILAAPEFFHAHQQSILALLWDHLLSWLFRRLSRMVDGGHRSAWLIPAFWLTLALLAGGSLLWWYRRQLHRAGVPAARTETRKPLNVQPREWERWLAEAEALAGRADWREAIHALYWAAITRLEAQGRWSRDRARTPREYLALLPHASLQGGDLALLTRSLEQTWYGSHGAGASDFEAARAAFARLEAR